MPAIFELLAYRQTKSDVAKKFTANVVAFLTQLLIDDSLFSGENRFENVRLSVFIAVSANSEINFVGIFINFVSFVDA